mmetsp:Transcript_2566/g.6706  ORF Transcript_2566/g.6706 Transcript_2566/m.6706 type:complete len:94 (-) Transcript_2566:440-721(-)
MPRVDGGSALRLAVALAVALLFGLALAGAKETGRYSTVGRSPEEEWLGIPVRYIKACILLLPVILVCACFMGCGRQPDEDEELKQRKKLDLPS